ncbi:MAG: alpha/beta hydrolase [Chloroflexi bacterium]|nr:alpha/beta hydrolase [Chloroflexota bacterium]
MPYLSLPDGLTNLYYVRHRGGAPNAPVVLIHGAGGSRLLWPAALRRLPGAEVYALDLPGHGRSPGPGCQSVAAYAHVVSEFVAAAGLKAAVLLGHSLGGAIALEVALRHPERAAGLVLLCSGARLRVAPALLAGLRDDYGAALDLLHDCLFCHETPPTLRQAGKAQLLAADPQVVCGDFAACHAFDAMAELSRVVAPTLVLGGTADRMTPPKYAEHLAAGIPQARLRLLPQGSHMVALEQPEAVAEAVSGFLAELHPAQH